MRQRQYTLTPTHVQAHASVRLQKHLRLKDHGRKCRTDTLCTVLLYAASRIISVRARPNTLAHNEGRKGSGPLTVKEQQATD